MKFSEMPYERPGVTAFAQEFEALLADFRNADSADRQIEVLDALNLHRDNFDTMRSIAHIRNTLNTQDPFYADEKRFFDQSASTILALERELYEAVTQSMWVANLQSAFGEQFLRIARMSLESFHPDVADEVTADLELVTEYTRLISSAQIDFQGETLTLSQMGKHVVSPDRETRQAAQRAKYGFFVEHESEFDDIYDRMVRVRTDMAKKLGYENYVPLAYKRMNRSDYDAAMVKQFRDQVKTVLVPLASKLRDRQRRRLGLDVLMYYDEPIEFPSGNPEPKGDPEWIMQQGLRMYQELSSETGSFMSFMMENELFDVLSRKGKRVGGYCTVIPNENAPYIFANFNGTSGDVRVLTHEAGHAFMAYAYRDRVVPEYGFPTLEAAEIHSFGMEFLTWGWMDRFFGDETEKFKFDHLSEAITSIPYMVAVDEFQHFVYENPTATPQERKQAWRDIERLYLPHRNYGDNDFLERGGYWQQQAHIYRTPFYYIDYALARICALQVWKRAQTDHAAAWADYLRLCKLGGSQSFLELVQAAGLVSPFEPGCVASVIQEASAWLDAVDDSTWR